MNTSIRVALILLLAFCTAYGQAAARSPEDAQLARLAGTWQVVGRMAEEQVAYVAEATYSVARRYLRFDLTRAADQGGPSLTWIFGFDAHRGSFVCFEIGADLRTRGPLVARFIERADGSVGIEIDDEASAGKASRVELHRA